MSHFILDCSQGVQKYYDEEYIIEQIHLVANSAGLFAEKDIKVRMNLY